MLVPARLRDGASWSDACILNVSSRGLLIHSMGAGETGATIELRHRDCSIVARVMWRDGARAGLRAEDRVPVEEIMLLGHAHNLTLTASAPPNVERRKTPRHEESRDRARAIEFASALVIAAVLSAGTLAMLESALARPLAAISAVLGG